MTLDLFSYILITSPSIWSKFSFLYFISLFHLFISRCFFLWLVPGGSAIYSSAPKPATPSVFPPLLLQNAERKWSQDHMSFGYIILPSTGMAYKPPSLHILHLSLIWDPSCCLFYCSRSPSLSLPPMCWPKTWAWKLLSAFVRNSFVVTRVT